MLIFPFTGSVNGVDNSAVAFYIEGRKTTAEEINQLRAKDVLRVEYYENDVEHFPNEQKVLNYILKRYESGGYVDVRANTQFIKQNGNYNAIASFDHKKMNYTILGSAGFANDHNYGQESMEEVGLGTPFVKYSQPIYGHVKSNNYGGLFRTTYNGKRTLFFGQASYSYGRMPVNYVHSTVNYTPQVYPSSESFTDARSHNATTSGILYLNTKMKNNSNLMVQVNYDFSNNHYDNGYRENLMSTGINAQTREKLHRIDA